MSTLNVDAIQNLAGDTPFAPVLATKQTATGSTVDFTGIPSYVTKIDLLLSEVSMTGTDDIAVLLGDSSGFETTGYVASSHNQLGTAANATTHILVQGTGAAFVLSGVITLRLIDSATDAWVWSGVIKLSTTASAQVAGSKSLSDTLTQIRFGTSGSDTFDSGAFNINYS